MSPATVGIFDSGVGGLSVWKEIAHQLPYIDLIYFADQAHCPYGSRPISELRSFSKSLVRFLIEQGADLVVIACNTASAAALHFLRQQFVLPIVGMEPAVKPAAACTRTKHIGVIATEVTFQGDLFASLLERYAQGITVHTKACPGLVERVEAGLVEDVETLALLHRYLQPLLDEHIDTLVLGCTHYPFLRPAIERIVGPGVKVVDPAPAVARQTARVLARSLPKSAQSQTGRRMLYTSGRLEPFAKITTQLLGIQSKVQAAHWDGARIRV